MAGCRWEREFKSRDRGHQTGNPKRPTSLQPSAAGKSGRQRLVVEGAVKLAVRQPPQKCGGKHQREPTSVRAARSLYRIILVGSGAEDGTNSWHVTRQVPEAEGENGPKTGH
jgi:hypothetical protein